MKKSKMKKLKTLIDQLEIQEIEELETELANLNNSDSVNVEVDRCRDCPYVRNNLREFGPQPVSVNWYCDYDDADMWLDNSYEIDSKCPLRG